MTALRAEGCGIAAFGGDEYIVSVTGLAFVSPVLHDKEAAEDRGVRSLLRIYRTYPQGFAQLLTFGRQKESALMGRLGALLRPNLAILCRIATVRKEPALRSYIPADSRILHTMHESAKVGP